ncbi:MAG: hypothetical protein ABI255_07825 [Microbacteriaceae bacterium]
MMPQIPPYVLGERSRWGQTLFVAGIVIASIIGLAIGLILAAFAAVAWVIRGVGWLVKSGLAWLWYGIRRWRGRDYPFQLRRPRTRASRRLALNDAYLSALPGVFGVVARTALWLFGPLALLISLIGVLLPRWRARPYFPGSMVDLETKLLGLGARRGYFHDGDAADVVTYGEFLSRQLPQLAEFLIWWRDPDASDPYRPPHPAAQAAPAVDADFGGVTLGPYPDPLGFPGLAAAAIQRKEIRGLRELFISQREIDDKSDPDLDDRSEVATIRIVTRIGSDGRRRWIVQSPSTQTWHPRAGAAPNDVTAAIAALAMREITLTRAVLDAMELAGVRREDLVLLGGFSLGGMVSAQLVQRCVERGFTVTHLVTAGAPIGRYDIPPTVRALSIEHLLDPIPHIDGRDNPAWPSTRPGAPEWISVAAGPPMARGYHLSATHHSPSYAETAGLLERRPPDTEILRFLEGDKRVAGALEFFGPDQELRDYAATRVGFSIARPAVPLYLHSTVVEGVTRGVLRTTLRRVPGVIAVDVYQSRTGLPSTILWNADVLVNSLEPWFLAIERRAVYRGLLSLLKRRRAIGIHFRLQAKESLGVTWEATVQRMADGRWREVIDVTFDTDEAETEFLPLLLPDGWSSTINYYPPDAFAPVDHLS